MATDAIIAPNIATFRHPNTPTIILATGPKTKIKSMKNTELHIKVEDINRTKLTLKAPRKTVSENVVCLCRLLNILADFSNLFLHTGKQCGP